MEQDEALFRSDSFRMSSMKARGPFSVQGGAGCAGRCLLPMLHVLPCSKRYVHDWTECPFAHPQEKARRRDPRLHSYTGIACPSMKKEGSCAFGDHCPYAHNVFEYWLHPTRRARAAAVYRTQLCNDGSNCKRKICFFAHSLDELRVPACKPFVSPDALAAAAAASAADAEAKRKAATIGSPVTSFGMQLSGSSVLSPQRSSLDSQPSQEDTIAGAGMQGSGELASPGPSAAEDAIHSALQQLQGGGFTAQEQQVIELVTSMLAQDKISPPQAASILQQMLPAAALHSLQTQLTTPRAAAAPPVDPLFARHSDPLGLSSGGAPPTLSPARLSLDSAAMAAATAAAASPRGAPFFQAPNASILGAAPGALCGPPSALEQLAAMQAVQGVGARGYALSAMRASMDSDRSSFDATGRMSFDASYPQDFVAPVPAAFTPRASAALDNSIPAPMYPQYWTGQALSTVPEGMPVLSTPPPRRSSNPWEGGDRLSADFGRLSFDGARDAAPLAASPYASSFFAPAVPGAGLAGGLPGWQPGMSAAANLAEMQLGARRGLGAPGTGAGPAFGYSPAGGSAFAELQRPPAAPEPAAPLGEGTLRAASR
eukprot:scaffold4.g5027.t1